MALRRIGNIPAIYQMNGIRKINQTVYNKLLKHPQPSQKSTYLQRFMLIDFTFQGKILLLLKIIVVNRK